MTRIHHVDPDHLRGEYDAMGAMLSEPEQVRLGAIVREADQLAFVTARAMARIELARVSGTTPAAVDFSIGEHGRPEVRSPEAARAYRFNISHTSGLVVCAVSAGHDVGVDVERVDRDADIDTLSARVLNESERDDLMRRSGGARRRRFFEYWTLKEAFIKAVGKGFGLPPRALTLELGDRIGARFDARVADDPAQWTFHLAPVGDTHVIGAALRNQATRPALARFSYPGSALSGG